MEMAPETPEPLDWQPEEYFERAAARRNMTPEQLRAQLLLEVSSNGEPESRGGRPLRRRSPGSLCAADESGRGRSRGGAFSSCGSVANAGYARGRGRTRGHWRLLLSSDATGRWFDWSQRVAFEGDGRAVRKG